MATVSAPQIDPNCPTAAAINDALNFLAGAVNALDSRVNGFIASNPGLAGVATTAQLTAHTSSLTPHTGMVRVAGSSQPHAINVTSLSAPSAGTYTVTYPTALTVLPTHIAITPQGAAPVRFSLVSYTMTQAVITVDAACVLWISILREGT